MSGAIRLVGLSRSPPSCRTACLWCRLWRTAHIVGICQTATERGPSSTNATYPRPDVTIRNGADALRNIPAAALRPAPTSASTSTGPASPVQSRVSGVAISSWRSPRASRMLSVVATHRRETGQGNTSGAVTLRRAWSCGAVRSARHPVKVEAAGSNPVRTARRAAVFGASRAGSSVGTSVRLKSGRSAVRPRPCPHDPPASTQRPTSIDPVGRCCYRIRSCPVITGGRRSDVPNTC